MNTVFDFSTEILQAFEARIIAELPAIIAQVSTDAIPLPSIATKNIHVGYFDPETYTDTPSIFIIPNQARRNSENETNCSYWLTQEFDVALVTSQGIGSARLVSYQLYNYIKSFLIFLNIHTDDYTLGDEGIEMHEALGADNLLRWGVVSVLAQSEVFY
jgi:hypothetical protein